MKSSRMNRDEEARTRSEVTKRRSGGVEDFRVKSLNCMVELVSLQKFVVFFIDGPVFCF